MALALEPAKDGVVTHAFFDEPFVADGFVALHHVADDHGHHDAFFEDLFVFFRSLAALFRVAILAHDEIIIYPGHGELEFLNIVDAQFHAASKFRHVNGLNTHAEVVFEKTLVHDGAGNAHGATSERHVALAADVGDDKACADEAEDFFFDIGRDGIVLSVLDVMTVNGECGQTFLSVPGEGGSQIDGTDAVQAVGAIPVDVKELGVDMLSMSAHKFNGPKGMGALYCRKGVWPQNLIDGGSQEARHRAGTENVAGIAAMGKALEIATAHLDERMAHESELRDYVIDRILKNIPEARLNGGRSPRLPNNVNISFPGLEGETILLDLDMHGICASTGSACNSDSLDPSHVLLSIGLPEEIGHGSMRFTFGPQNTMEEAKYLCDVLEEVIPRRRAMSCMWLQGQNKARQFSLKGEQ